MKAVSLTSHQHPVDKGEGLFSSTISRHIRTILRKTLCCLFPHKEANYSSLPTEWQHPDMMSLSTNAHPFILFLPLHLFKSPSPLVTASQVNETTSNATLWPTHAWYLRAEMEHVLHAYLIAQNIQLNAKKLLFRPNCANGINPCI